MSRTHKHISVLLYSNPLQTAHAHSRMAYILIYARRIAFECDGHKQENTLKALSSQQFGYLLSIELPTWFVQCNFLCISFLGFVFVRWNVTFGRDLFIYGIYFNELWLMKLWLDAWENEEWIVKWCWFQYTIHTTSKTLMATLRKCCTLPIFNAAGIGRKK